MAVCIHGHRKRRVPKAVLDDFEMHTGGHEHGGVGMAETVKGESHKPDAPAVDRKFFGDIVLRRRPFCFPVPGGRQAPMRATRFSASFRRSMLSGGGVLPLFPHQW